MNKYSNITKCPITDSSEGVKYFDLGNIPLVNNLCSSREESLTAERFPLDINYYPNSGESSLSIAINSKLLFSKYLFKSEVNKPYYPHCQKMFYYIQNYINLYDGVKIIDIGGNDGSLLDAFRSVSNYKLQLLNIDPSENLSTLSLDKNIPTKTAFFNHTIAEEINEKVEVIVSTNVFQHLKDINSFAKGVSLLLKDEGIWVLEFPYWIHDMQTNQFDQIYHEHVYYHSIRPMKMMMEKHGMKINNITKQKIHGGTLRLIISKESSKHTIDNTVDNYLQSEEKYDLDYHLNWGNNIQNHINESSKFIKKLKEEGKTIFGFGAAAKGCVYLNAMGITNKEINYIIDDTDLKQNKYIPGTGIQVVSRNILLEETPDYILILPHNFLDFILKSLHLEYKGKFITLIPNIKIHE